MKPELQKYYENRFTTMATQGWVDLIEDVEGMIAATEKLGGIETIEQLHYKKGELSILYWLKNLKDASAEVYDQLQQEDKDAETLI